MLNVGVISTFPPTQCGIAAYASDLTQSLRAISNEINPITIPVILSPMTKTDEIVIESNNAEKYYLVCDYINSNEIDIVDIQHEFKLYGVPDGENIVTLLYGVQKPIVSTLHTVFPNLNPQRERVFNEVIKRSDLLYVFSIEAKQHVIETYKKSADKIKVIPHGAPFVDFKQPKETSLRKSIPAPIVFVSAGHLRNTKGYEIAIRALHEIKKEGIDFHYLILGSNHPKNETAQSYRRDITNLIKELGMSDNVSFVDEYLNKEQLIEYIRAADVGLLPYTRKEQSSSGILALMIACGKPVVSTPFQFANSYISKLSGIVSDSFDDFDFELAIKSLIKRQQLWNKISKHNHETGRSWAWENVAAQYAQGYKAVVASYQ